MQTFNGNPADSVSPYIYSDFINSMIQYLISRGDLARLFELACYAEARASLSAQFQPPFCQDEG